RRFSPDDRTRRPLTDIVQAAGRASGISRQLLAYSRRQLLQTAIFDVREALLALAPLLERLVGDDIVVDLDLGDLPAGVSADRGQLEQAVVNLACNARDAMPRGGRLAITLDLVDARGAPGAPRPGPNVRIVVADTGEGMDEATRSRAFEPFFTTKAIGRGTGLGLSTVYGMVTQSGGAVQLDSAPGQGTRVTLLLPSVDLDPTVEVPLPDLPAGTETVLVVEDEPLVQESVVASLEDVGFRVHHADDGVAALDLLDGGLTVDLVLSDVRMPRLGGLELLGRLRARGLRMPVMLMSGNPLRVADADCEVLAKPFSTEELVEEVRRFLDRDRG
ncbi:MAG: ATP-binding protein, partial [Myxococcota bacterium]